MKNAYPFKSRVAALCLLAATGYALPAAASMLTVAPITLPGVMAYACDNSCDLNTALGSTSTDTAGLTVSQSDSVSSASATATYSSLTNVVSTTGANTAASSAASWWDLVTITGASGSAGTTGTASVQIAGVGNVTVGAGGSAMFGNQLWVDSEADWLAGGDNQINAAYGYIVYSSPTAGTQSLDLVDNGNFTFTYGTPFVLELVDGAMVSGAAAVDPSMNITNAGISNIVLPVGATLSSLSGTVYHVSAVPLPAAGWLFGSGLVGLLVAGRRKTVRPSRSAR